VFSLCRIKRSLIAPAFAIVVLFCAAGAPAAHAGLSTWTSLVGLTASDPGSPGWVRVYATGTPPTTIYAGTEGDGVFKSVDDGLTWAPFSSGLDADGLTVDAIYTSGGMVYAGTDGGLFSAPDSVASGGSWTPLAQGPDPDPEHPTMLNVAVQALISLTGGPMLAGTASEGVYTSGDKGATWTPPADDNGMPAGTTVWSFASFANFVWAATSNGIYRSSDQGTTWSLSSDGLPFATTLGVFQDTQNPLIYYAETASDGLWRSVDGGTTWQSANGDPDDEPFGGDSTPTIHAIQEFSGPTQTRLYTATSDGLWVGTLPNVTVPGPGGQSLEVPGQIIWRPVTQDGLGDNTIMWALSSFTTVPGTLLAGTQSNGGYSLTFQPPLNDGAPQDLPSWLAASILPLNVGTQLVGTAGNWSGTPQIDFSYQWQRCDTTQAGSCSDISGATNQLYTLVAADQGKYIRDVVTGTNDFPSPAPISTAKSEIRGPVGAQPGPLPGDNQESAPTIVDISPGADPALPTEGDTLSAPDSSQDPAGWLFNPPADADSITYQWLLCDANGDNCAAIPGATQSTYVLTAADDELTLRVQVTGSNSYGTTTLPLSAATNTIIPLPATATSPPQLLGNAYVGSTLVGTVGTWANPATYWTRQWEQCEPDGSDCSPIPGATSPEYTVQPGDLGMTLLMDVTAGVVPANHLPLPVDVDTPLSAVVAEPPSVTPTPTPTTTTTTPSPTPQPTPAPPAKPASPQQSKQVVPALSKLGLTKVGGLRLTLSAPGSVRIVLARRLSGHVAKHRCIAGKRKHAPVCTLYQTVETIERAGLAAGGHVIPLPTSAHGHRLKPGNYRLTITPAGAAGDRGKAQTISIVLG
jgi:hypothetical protein